MLNQPEVISQGTNGTSQAGLHANPIQSGLATVKRNSMSRAEGQALLEEAFRASTLSRRGRGAEGVSATGGEGRGVPFRREASVPRTSGAWSDSLPRKDLFTSNTNSLPRRDKVSGPCVTAAN